MARRKFDDWLNEKPSHSRDFSRELDGSML